MPSSSSQTIPNSIPPQRQPVLPATFDAEAETLLMRRLAARPGHIQVLRLWRAPARLADGTPLWIGGTQTLHFGKPLAAFSMWRPEADDGVAHVALRDALDGLPLRESPHPQTGAPVLRIRTTPTKPR
ncbi:MAG: hypothetical protein LC715_08040 [Gammaproteobacteria bacterium]|nr:hypothetical protein [Gammaproteobacteria bacterium]